MSLFDIEHVNKRLSLVTLLSGEPLMDIATRVPDLLTDKHVIEILAYSDLALVIVNPMLVTSVS